MILIWTHSLQRIVDFNKHSLQYSQRSWSCLCSCSWGPHSYWKIQLIINDHDHQNLPLVYIHHPGDEPLYHVHLPLPRSPEKIFPSLTQHQISQKFQHIDNYRKGKLLYILDTSPGLDWNVQKLQIWFCLYHSSQHRRDRSVACLAKLMATFLINLLNVSNNICQEECPQKNQ